MLACFKKGFWKVWLRAPFQKHIFMIDKHSGFFLTYKDHPVGMSMVKTSVKTFTEAGFISIERIIEEDGDE